MKKYLIERPMVSGFLGMLGLVLFYVGTLTLANSPQHAYMEFQRFWYLIVPLISLFGLQVGVFTYMVKKASVGKKSLAATGGVSGGAMVVCCLHHVFEVLPMLGLTGAALALANYQASFLSIGIISGFVGLLWMFKMMKNHNLYYSESFWNSLMKYNWPFLANLSLVFGLLSVFFISLQIVGGLL